MSDELAVALCAVANEPWIVTRRHRVECDRRPDAVLLQHVEHAKNADAMPVLAVRHRPELGYRTGEREVRIQVGRLNAVLGRSPLDMLEGDDHT